ncbi:hypothetical protein [Nocardioides bruguierae]|uniref:hypothetical protein n=1 Tax=Nocardioides bruguierae TaxID=2945102 RepID=UPI002343014C|nr:hypothetical protein [Nocardioides bruguierae]
MSPTTRRLLYAVVFGVFIMTIVVLVNGLSGRIDRAEEDAQENRVAAADNAAALGEAENITRRLARQVRRLGGTPVVTPSDIEPATGPAGPVGAIGPPGPRGPAGQDGEDGEDGTDGQDGADGKRGRTGATGATGETGATGATGAAGADGTDGKTGATGATGPQGPAGPKGETGATGPRGETGATGPAGYPETFTFTDRTGATYTCTDPDEDRAYDCTSDAPGAAS